VVDVDNPQTGQNSGKHATHQNELREHKKSIRASRKSSLKDPQRRVSSV
jgi:hypothetical protein